MKKIQNNNYHIQEKVKKIRIIGGKWKGKKINIIHHKYLKPTTSQIRETLFNWLTPIIYGAKCLDCFAGSGSLGLEALSRYANSVTFLEQNKIIYKKLNKTIQLLKIQKQTKTFQINCNNWLINTNINNTNQPYNIVFLDPPFKKLNDLSHTIQLLENFPHLAKNAWIYIENLKYNNQNFRITFPNNWKLHKKKSQVTFLIKSILDLKKF